MSEVRITDAGLFIEAVRRLRGRAVPHSHPLAWTPANPERLISGLSELMSPHDMRKVCNELLTEGQIIIVGWKTTYDMKAVISGYSQGLVTRLHPDVPFKQYQQFTSHGTPRPNVRKRKHYVDIFTLQLKGVYVTSDGLPKKVVQYREKQQIAYP